ncbi:TetR/AcrR family transcriptional regulator [Cellulomonas xiejunii]|uniref:TetR/AcrR family transcriptional regulator n=1 Tax=Cellulomonas xiejunii TaxID=2968083 RepID=A0ABY5KRL5_9CELL|nr:TetR/AcrR family transcriptional regulator [Cellulomonas xiejunii]MCC2314046.1 TetR/AcrR family transcriptional regulator; helix-turn-helix transcriptional regulator [Cellulomonas xiejunii]MCC2322327.1 TetR/AcrR family transcriptional regulator; helix-turn-helix transcriptional regulator [Cellulomonas xiejunii]UUI72378.1 TetR/AcrR family transcriptional regulator [Cellulomonas xiejunii]
MTSARRDAARNRAAVIAAAERVFATQGLTAPLSEVAREAGVGRATVYRHFPDRNALAAALYGHHLDDAEALAAARAGQPGAFAAVVRRIAEGQHRLTGLFPLMRSAPDAAGHLDALGERIATIVTGPLADAIRLGEVSPDVTVADVHLVLTMVEGLLTSHDDDERAAALDRGLTIALAGLRP